MTRKIHTPLTALAGLALAAGSAHGALLVYEGFEYGSPGDPLHGQPDGAGTPADVDAVGLGGTWQDQTSLTASDFRIVDGSLVFGDLPVNGNHVAPVDRLHNDIHVRPITADLAAGGELWFSILAEKVANNFSNGQGGLVIGNQAVNNSQINKDTGSSGLVGFGFGPTSAGTNWKPFAWDGTAQTAGDAALTVGVGNGEIHLLVGHISFNTGTGGTDEYTLYDYELNAGSIQNGTLIPIAGTIEIDVDETLLNTLSLTRHVETSYDEIRIGTTLAAVTGGDGGNVPSESFPLSITPATTPDTGYDLAWESQAGKLYNLRTSTDLAGAISTWTLVQGEIAATPPTNTANVDPIDPRRFYAVEEYNAPPPPPLFTSDFEADDGGFTVSTTAGSAWEWGVPASDNGQAAPNDLVLTAGNSGTSAWATNLGTADEGFYTNPTTTSLRSPVIDLTTATTATITFAEAVDLAATDSAAVYVISEIDETVIAGPIHTSSTGAILTADWAIANSGDPIALPPAALGQPVRLEWRFTGGTNAFLGWYIDDVTVNAE